MKTGCLVAAMALLLLATAVSAAGPRNIFDDDWTPPKASETPRPAPVKPATVPPAPTPDNPTPAVPTPTAPAARRAVPKGPEQAAVRKVLKEVFAEQLVDRSVPARRKLSGTLLGEADKSAGTPADQFVLLAAAIDAAVDAADLPLAFRAADRMAGAFEVDALAVKADAAARLNPKGAPPESASGNVDAGLDLAEQLVGLDDYAAAVRLCAAIQTLAAGNADLRARVQQRQREVGAARDAHEKIARDTERLKAYPDDPAANLSVGRYVCLVKGDWARGLPMLAKGSDAALKALAAQELAGGPPASDADAVARLADGWWDAAAKQSDAPSRAGVMRHAADLYQQAVAKAQGLRRVQIEKRIAEAARSAASVPGKMASGGKRVVDLLKMADPKRDAVNGEWQSGVTGLTCDNRHGNTRLAVPYDPPDEYDYHVAFTRNEDKGTVSLLLSRNGHTVGMVFWGNDKETDWGMRNVDGQERWANPTTGKRDGAFKTGRRYDGIVQVRKESVSVFLDGDKLFTLKTDFSNLKDPLDLPARSTTLGVGTNQCSVTFHAIEILEVTGNGKSTVPSAAR